MFSVRSGLVGLNGQDQPSAQQDLPGATLRPLTSIPPGRLALHTDTPSEQTRLIALVGAAESGVLPGILPGVASLQRMC